MIPHDTGKRNVKENYDREAEQYRRSSDVQRVNLENIFLSARRLIDALKPKRIVDVGCGLGSAIQVMTGAGLFGDVEYLGIDLSPGMIAIAKEIHQRDGVRFLAGDAEALEAGDESADLVVANAMLHWLNQPKLGNTPLRALSEMHRVLKPGGLVLLGTPAVEAHLFIIAYKTVASRHAHESFFDEKLYCEDPLGCMQLFELVEYVKAASFQVESAMTLYQNYPFVSAAEFAASVRAYGYNAYMTPFAAGMREKIWAEIVQTFEQSMGPGPYMHEIYQNNLIARKPRL